MSNAALAPCPSCKRHVKVSEGSCPFCKHVLPSEMNAKGDVSIRGLSRAAAYALSASIVVVGCTGGPGDPTENGTSGGTSGTSGGSSGSTGTSGATSSGSTSGTSGGTSSGTSGTTSGGPNDGGNVQPPYGAPAYGAPAYGAVPVDGGS